MKAYKHQNNATDKVEELEHVVEGLSPTEPVRLNDVFRLAGVTTEDRAMRRTAVQLLQKYGITYKE